MDHYRNLFFNNKSAFNANGDDQYIMSRHLEQRTKKLNDEIKSLKSSLPVSGSLVDTFIYKKTVTKTLRDGESYTCTARFIPTNQGINEGIIEMSIYAENWLSSPSWVQYNPVGAQIVTGYRTRSAGYAESYVWGAQSTGDGYNWEARVTATVYGTIEGEIEFIWS